ncbi:hypothetical protein [Actinophytocola sp.]|uniref:hypothetical protein n=1 Tax=Actinophytocola sp. TaxID=1872138 RepID=UPI002D800BE9|nr:hypothetical protein [Actinophytocola sp.]HET9144448.1 hypothetical protein [Actinophytocola sp.]
MLTLGVLAFALAGAALWRLRRELRELERQAHEMARRVEALPVELTKVFGTEDRYLISVELLNLFELAHKKTWVARPLTVLTPRLLRDAIHRKVVGRVRENLASAGVEADVRVHRVR